MNARTHDSSHAPPADSASASVLAADPVFQLHRGGKIEVSLSVPLDSRDDLSMAYTG
jgi:malate dehydrogenase (oxaloacetate-decarboxylating)